LVVSVVFGLQYIYHKTLQLLNNKSEDEDIEARAGLKKQNDLLQQLLKDDDNVRQHKIMLEVIY
jgi:hypothetical protein